MNRVNRSQASCDTGSMIYGSQGIGWKSPHHYSSSTRWNLYCIQASTLIVAGSTPGQNNDIILFTCLFLIGFTFQGLTGSGPLWSVSEFQPVFFKSKSLYFLFTDVGDESFQRTRSHVSVCRISDRKWMLSHVPRRYDPAYCQTQSSSGPTPLPGSCCFPVFSSPLSPAELLLWSFVEWHFINKLNLVFNRKSGKKRLYRV